MKVSIITATMGEVAGLPAVNYVTVREEDDVEFYQSSVETVVEIMRAVYYDCFINVRECEEEDLPDWVVQT